MALIGTTTLLDHPAATQTLLQALSELGTQSLHPELANIPILFVGHSQGGCTAYGFSRVHGARVAGFITMKGGCHNPGPAGAAAAVPGYFLIGRLDEPHRRENITPVFEAGRAAGAPWALSIDAFGHGPIVDLDLMFDWIDAVLAARLPATRGGAAPCDDGNGRLARQPVDRRDLDVRVLRLHSFERELAALSRDGARLAADGGRNRRRECVLKRCANR